MSLEEILRSLSPALQNLQEKEEEQEKSLCLVVKRKRKPKRNNQLPIQRQWKKRLVVLTQRELPPRSQIQNTQKVRTSQEQDQQFDLKQRLRVVSCRTPVFLAQPRLQSKQQIEMRDCEYDPEYPKVLISREGPSPTKMMLFESKVKKIWSCADPFTCPNGFGCRFIHWKNKMFEKMMTELFSVWETYDVNSSSVLRAFVRAVTENTNESLPARNCLKYLLLYVQEEIIYSSWPEKKRKNPRKIKK